MSSQDERFFDYKLNPDNIPEQFHHLIPLAQYWGTLGGIEYQFLAKKASNEELSQLIRQVQPYYYLILDEWLSLDNSTLTGMSNEYIAFTDLLSSVDYAHLQLNLRKNK